MRNTRIALDKLSNTNPVRRKKFKKYFNGWPPTFIGLHIKLGLLLQAKRILHDHHERIGFRGLKSLHYRFLHSWKRACLNTLKIPTTPSLIEGSRYTFFAKLHPYEFTASPCESEYQQTKALLHGRLRTQCRNDLSQYSKHVEKPCAVVQAILNSLTMFSLVLNQPH
jgi:hypothetical protein